MKRILFVCHGNICRSPMAEYIMKDLVRRAGAENQISIRSAATSAEELGNPVYLPARQTLTRHGVPYGNHCARRLTAQDYSAYDLFIGMDKANMRNMCRILGGDPEGKVHLLLDYAGRPGRRWPIPGIPEILRPHTGTFWRGAAGCWTSCCSKSPCCGRPGPQQGQIGSG